MAVDTLERYDRCVTPETLSSGASGATPARTMTLPFDQRQRARQRGQLDDGAEIAVVLPRGTIMRGGDYLLGVEGGLVRVIAADEPVSFVAGAPDGLTRAAYHLGNRHVWVELGDGRVCWLQDHVLDAMIEGFGLEVRHARLPFEPEGGAYSHEHAGDSGEGHVHSHGGTQ